MSQGTTAAMVVMTCTITAAACSCMSCYFMWHLLLTIITVLCIQPKTMSLFCHASLLVSMHPLCIQNYLTHAFVCSSLTFSYSYHDWHSPFVLLYDRPLASSYGATHTYVYRSKMKEGCEDAANHSTLTFADECCSGAGVRTASGL